MMSFDLFRNMFDGVVVTRIWVKGIIFLAFHLSCFFNYAQTELNSKKYFKIFLTLKKVLY